MIERCSNSEKAIEKIREFASVLASWDRRITKIVAIGELNGDDANKEGKINLICTFNPEPTSDNSGFISIINLMLRDDYEGISEQLGIPLVFDLGFRMRNKVYLANGEVLNELGEHIHLWTRTKNE